MRSSLARQRTNRCPCTPHVFGSRFMPVSRRSHEGEQHAAHVDSRHGLRARAGSFRGRANLAAKGVAVLPNSYEITPQDLQDALRKQRVALAPGDAVLIYT